MEVEFDENKFKDDMRKFLGYIVINHCLCGSSCEITGNNDEKMIPVFNKYMTILKNKLLKKLSNLEDDTAQKLDKYKTCKNINVVYIYDNDTVKFDDDNRQSTFAKRASSISNATSRRGSMSGERGSTSGERGSIFAKRARSFSNTTSGGNKRVSMLETFTNEILIEYGILTKRYGDYYILSSSKLFTWSNIHKMSISDVLNFVTTYKRNVIIHKNKGMLVGMLKLFMGETNELKRLDDEEGILQLQILEEYNELYRRFIEILRCIFWLYRKMSVDSIIGDSVNNVAKGEVDAVSVGSTKLVSDYDVTLYGNFKLMSEVIKEFDRVMSRIYGNTSEVIFDTNVYGTSFIKLAGRVIFSVEEDNYLYKKGNICRGVDFSYVMGGSKEEVMDMQHMWAFIKVLKALKMIEKFDVRLYESLYKYMESGLHNTMYLEKAVSFMSFLNKRMDYVEVLESYENLLSKLKDEDRVSLTNMYISLVNYYGSETYFTRGAFLDVVANQQMCGISLKKCGKDYLSPVTQGVTLNESESMDSVIENIGEMMMHVNRVKYVDRVEGAIMLLNRKNKSKYCEILSTIRDVQKNCSEDIINCGAYAMLHSCVVLLVGCFNEYIKGKSVDEDKLQNMLTKVKGALFEPNFT